MSTKSTRSPFIFRRSSSAQKIHHVIHPKNQRHSQHHRHFACTPDSFHSSQCPLNQPDLRSYSVVPHQPKRYTTSFILKSASPITSKLNSISATRSPFIFRGSSSAQKIHHVIHPINQRHSQHHRHFACTPDSFHSSQCPLNQPDLRSYSVVPHQPKRYTTSFILKSASPITSKLNSISATRSPFIFRRSSSAQKIHHVIHPKQPDLRSYSVVLHQPKRYTTPFILKSASPITSKLNSISATRSPFIFRRSSSAQKIHHVIHPKNQRHSQHHRHFACTPDSFHSSQCPLNQPDLRSYSVVPHQPKRYTTPFILKSASPKTSKLNSISATRSQSIFRRLSSAQKIPHVIHTKNQRLSQHHRHSACTPEFFHSSQATRSPSIFRRLSSAQKIPHVIHPKNQRLSKHHRHFACTPEISLSQSISISVTRSPSIFRRLSSAQKIHHVIHPKNQRHSQHHRHSACTPEFFHSSQATRSPSIFRRLSSAQKIPHVIHPKNQRLSKHHRHFACTPEVFHSSQCPLN
uniref:Mucin-5AC-like n=1 Tax=Haemonchus contortus TaxID=6289 RepID=A0A7I4Z334_HAECO